MATHLTHAERYQIELCYAQGLSQACMALRLGRAKSTISNETKRGWIDGRYWATHGENAIGLLRQYLPKYRSQRRITQDHLDAFAHRLNHRPRVSLGGRTPHEVLFNLTPVRIRT